MAALSNYSEDLLLAWQVTTGSATRPTAWYVALFTTATGDDGTGTELSGNGYSRQEVTFDTPSGGVTSNTGALLFGPCTGSNWGEVTHCAVFDASTSGNMLWHGALSASKTINVGEALQFDVGEITLSLT